MKTKFLFIACVILIIASVFLIAGCREDEETYHEIVFPKQSERNGYELQVLDSVFSVIDDAEGKYELLEGENLEFEITASEGYTLEDIVVKDNGKVLAHEEIQSRYKYKIENVAEKHTITVEGVKLKKFKVKLHYPFYKSGNNNSIEYKKSFDALKFKYGNNVLFGPTSIIHTINSSEIELEYGQKFEIWMGEEFPGIYEDINILYVASAGFDGVFAISEEGGGFQSIPFPNAQRVQRQTNEDDDYIYQDFMYKYVIEVNKDLDIYINTLELRKKTYNGFSVSNDVYKVAFNRNEIYYDTEWSFELTLTYYEEYPEMYEDIEIYVNEERTEEGLTFDEQNGVYHFTSIGRPPSSFNASDKPEMHSSFRVMAKGINLEANGDNQETKIVFKDNDFIDFPIFCREENPLHHQYAPYYYEDGEYYYLKDEPYIEVYFENLPQYDFSEMTVTVNDTEKDIVLEPDQTNQNISLILVENAPGYQSENGYWRIRIEGDYKDAYEITVNGIKMRKFDYTVRNDYADECQLYLILDDKRILIEDTYSFQLEDRQEFKFNLIVANPEKADEFAEYMNGVDIDYVKGNYVGKSGYNVEGGYCIEWILKASAAIDKDGREFSVAKK